MALKNKHDILKLYSDADGVCINWLQGFIDYMHSIGIAAEHEQPNVFSMTDIFPTLEKPWEHIHDYQLSDIYRNIRAYDDAKLAFRKIEQLGGEVIIVSSCGKDKKVIESRMHQIESEFGSSVKDVILLDYASPKLDTLKQLPSGIFIDDQGKIAIEGAQAGHRSLIRNQSYNINEHHPDVYRIHNMAKVSQAIEESLEWGKMERLPTH